MKNYKDFKPGHVFSYKDREYLVIKNYGKTGLVKELSGSNMLINGFFWNDKNDKITYLRTEKLENINELNKEFENFFEKI